MSQSPQRAARRMLSSSSWSIAAAALLLSACGGAGEGAESTAEAGASAAGGVRMRALAVATPAQSRWSALRTLPLVPVSMANLPDGKLLLWSAEEKFSFRASTGRTYSLSYDPATDAVSERTVTETGHNMFCPGTTNLADGRILVNGGISSARTSLFNPATGTWTTGAAMNIPRGYQANTLLSDGSVLTLGGSWSGGVGNKHGEVWTEASGWRVLSGVPITPFLSPDPSRNFGGDSHFMLIPTGNGKVFHPGPGVNMHWIDTQGNGSVRDAGPRGDDEFSVSGTTVMFDTGKVLKVGGGPGYDSVNANANSYVIDLNAGAQVRKLAPMAYRRAFHNSVVLPNGQVLIVGGQTFAVGFSDNNSVLVPELFDPVTERFQTLPPIASPRNYHSVAMLLPDARVVSAGGGLCGAGCAANHPDLQILTPHYLLRPDGSPATRPVITNAPSAVRYGQTATVTTDSDITAFAMVRMSSTTHTVNNDQRRLSLSFRATGAQTYAVDIPSNPGWALAGDWMLFAMNADGTPSVAKIVRLGLDGGTRIQPIDDVAGLTGTAAALQPVATLPAGLTGSWSASGLPPGLVIDAGTGRISGTPVLAGTFPVSVKVAAGGIAVSTEFVWAVEPASALVSGLKGEYFAGTAFTGTPLRVASEVPDFSWGTAAPAANVPADNFAVRWSGWLLPSVTGNHTLQTLSDDGVRVWVNNVLVIDNWTPHSATLNNSAALSLVAGVRVPIRVEYFEATGDAALSLRWSTPTNATFVPVPAANLLSSSLLPNQAPSFQPLVLPTTFQGQALTLRIGATDPDGDALAWSANGLPNGLSLDLASGTVSGTPTTAGTFDVTVGVTDGRGGNAITRFNWVVQAATPEVLPVQTTPAAAGASVSFSAQMATPSAYTYQWDFGDGSPATGASDAPTANHVFSAPGVYLVTVTARTADGRTAVRTFWQAVQGAVLGQAGRSSSPIVTESRAGSPARVWVVNPDNDSVSVIDTTMNTRIAEIAVGRQPRTLAFAPDGRLWVVNQGSASVSIVSPSTLAVVQTVALPRASKPFGIVIGGGGAVYVSLEATGQVLRLTAAGAVSASASVGANVRHLALNAAGTQLLATRFITPPLPGEGTAAVQTSVAGVPRGGELLVLDATSLALQRTVVLQHSEKEDTTVQGRGVPNYLGAPVIAPDGLSAWVPSKQDNVKRGSLRDGRGLDFQNSVRAISSRINLVSQTEDLAARVDHDNAGVASAAAWHPGGAYLFVALETSRQVAVLDPAGRRELFRVDAGRAPQGLSVSADGLRLYVHNFMDRSVSVLDLARLLQFGESKLPLVASVAAVGSDQLAPAVLKGKQFFYDARDIRLARDGYLSCASCHADGGHDGRTWDFTGFGEGLRNTPSLRGRAGGQGRLHWSGNFDEVQDFEGQIRAFAQGTGLMSDAQFNTGTRATPLGDPKAGVSADLDALAAYLASLSASDPSPHRNADGSLTANAVAGRTVFAAQCATCHGGTDFTDSASGVLRNIGTLKASSGQRLGAALTGLDTPTLRDVWATAPYLHDGSAASVDDAVRAHTVFSLSATELADVSAFVRQIGREEPAVVNTAAPVRSSSVYGDAGGTAFTDPVATGQQLTGVTVRHGSWIDAIQGLATPANLPLHGGSGGTVSTFTLAAGEFLVRVYGKQGSNPVTPAISQISFVTNTGRVYGPFGADLGQNPTTPFDVSVPAGSRIVGFQGRAGAFLNAVGVLYVEDTPAPSTPSTPIIGPVGGTLFTDPVVSGQRLTGVTVRAGYWLDAIQGLAAPADLPSHGGTGGGVSSFTLAAGEYLVRVFGLQGANPNNPAIAQISFVTNTGRVYGPYGLGLGQGTTTPFDLRVPVGGRIVGFTGRAGTYLNALGLLYVQDVPAPVPLVSPIFGNAGGTAFSDPVVAAQVLTGVTVRAGSWVDSIQGLATPLDLPVRGGGGGVPNSFTLAPGEFLVRVYGKQGGNAVTPAISQISFVSNAGRVFGPYGADLGQNPTTPFDWSVPAGGRIVGFTGRAGTFLNAIGVLYLP